MPETPPSSSDDEDDLVQPPMSYVEKRKLQQDIHSLPGDKIDHVVRIIREREPSLNRESDPDEIEVRVTTSRFILTGSLNSFEKGAY